MKNTLIASVIAAAMSVLPAFSSASTYQYVNTNGNLSTVAASSATQALAASDIAAHSGVRLVQGTLSFTGFVPAGANTYEYVDVNGNIKMETANNATQALAASDIAAHSGVKLVTQ